LALNHFKEPSRIRRKAIQQLLNYWFQDFQRFLCSFSCFF
jgi:hypothetical protein